MAGLTGLAGCSDEPTVADARGFRDAPLYWVGESFEGLPLTGIGFNEFGGGFIYGTCEPPRDEGGCAPPLQIQTIRMCAPRVPTVPLTDRLALGGVPAGSRGGGLVLLSRAVEVRIFVSSRSDVGRALRAAAALHSANPDGPGAVRPNDALPQPPPDAEARGPCR